MKIKAVSGCRAESTETLYFTLTVPVHVRVSSLLHLVLLFTLSVCFFIFMSCMVTSLILLITLTDPSCLLFLPLFGLGLLFLPFLFFYASCNIQCISLFKIYWAISIFTFCPPLTPSPPFHLFDVFLFYFFTSSPPFPASYVTYFLFCSFSFILLDFSPVFCFHFCFHLCVFVLPFFSTFIFFFEVQSSVLTSDI